MAPMHSIGKFAYRTFSKRPVLEDVQLAYSRVCCSALFLRRVRVRERERGAESRNEVSGMPSYRAAESDCLCRPLVNSYFL
jgi:hypothetical protein